MHIHAVSWPLVLPNVSSSTPSGQVYGVDKLAKKLLCSIGAAAPTCRNKTLNSTISGFHIMFAAKTSDNGQILPTWQNALNAFKVFWMAIPIFVPV